MLLVPTGPNRMGQRKCLANNVPDVHLQPTAGTGSKRFFLSMKSPTGSDLPFTDFL